MHRLSDLESALELYNETAELPEGYAVGLGGAAVNDITLSLFSKSNFHLCYLSDVFNGIGDCYLATVSRHNILLARSTAWQHALDAALTAALDQFPKIASTVVTSASGLTSVELYKLPLPSGPRFVAAEITIQRGPITLKSHARDVSIGQIVAAIAG
jgi:hypothetical protein